MDEKRKVLVLLLIFCSLLVSVTKVGIVKADTTIYIKQSGDIESTELIERDGDVYRFTGDINVPIIVERNNIVIDGNGYTLDGPRAGVAINLTTSNVTVKNIQIMDWNTGILGVYNNNTILDNAITGCNSGMKIYTKEYKIIGNYIANKDVGILLGPGSELNIVSKNHIANNTFGLRLIGYASDSMNVIVENIIAFNDEGIFVWWHRDRIVQQIYRNNFINNVQQVSIVGASPIFGKKASSTWNNGSEDNYWSDYNGTDPDINGIGDTTYVIGDKDIDIYPLMGPVDVDVIPEFPLWIIFPLFLTLTLFVVTCRKRMKKSCQDG